MKYILIKSSGLTHVCRMPNVAETVSPLHLKQTCLDPASARIIAVRACTAFDAEWCSRRHEITDGHECAHAATRNQPLCFPLFPNYVCVLLHCIVKRIVHSMFFVRRALTAQRSPTDKFVLEAACSGILAGLF